MSWAAANHGWRARFSLDSIDSRALQTSYLTVTDTELQGLCEIWACAEGHAWDATTASCAVALA